jgi:hypothetical protein
MTPAPYDERTRLSTSGTPQGALVSQEPRE